MSDLEQLIAGFQSFHRRYVADRSGRYRELAEYGPHSRILMIACCDSRADPAIITNASVGDLMVIRNIANLVPPYEPGGHFQETRAALDFAGSYLNIEHIIVMGHSRCGGIRSLLTRLLDDSEPRHLLEEWTSVAEPAARAVLDSMPGASLDEQACACSRRALVASMRNLDSYPWVIERRRRGSLAVHGWYFNLADGALEHYDEATDSFKPF
jgi:carbonic anhydrase